MKGITDNIYITNQYTKTELDLFKGQKCLYCGEVFIFEEFISLELKGKFMLLLRKEAALPEVIIHIGESSFSIPMLDAIRDKSLYRLIR